MGKEIKANNIATGIGVNTSGAVKSIAELEHAVAGATNEWKVMESQMKRNGDDLGASETKYKGLTDAVNKQQAVLNQMREEQSKVSRETEEGSKIYDAYGRDIAKAEAKLTSLTKQQERAEQAYQRQSTGINQLTKEIQQNNRETDAHVQRLEAEGKQVEANEARRKGYATTLEKQTKLYEAQNQELKRLEASGEASADSISKQKIAMDKTATAIANGKSKLAELDGQQSAFGKNKGADEAGNKMDGFKGKIGKSKEALVAMGATATAVLGAVGKAISEAYDAQSQVNELQAKTTLGYSKSKESIKAVNALYAQGFGESMDDLQETYSKIAQLNPNASVKQLAEDTKLVSTYAKLSGADTEEVMAGADKATRNWHISYKEYFDNMTQLQKMGDDQAGDVSDNMAEYSQVLGQMGLSISDTMALIDNGVKSGAYNGDKLLDFTKEFQISLNDGRMDEAIKSFSKKSQDMFKGYKDGKVSAGDMFKQITGEMGKMTDKQKEATIASNLWSALGEDNSLKVIESLGKTNKGFDDVKGTADKTSKQLKESNPFELLKRSAEASISSVSMSAGETKKFKEAMKPLQKAIADMVQTAVDNLPKIAKALTPIVEFISTHGKLIVDILGTILAVRFVAKSVSGLSKLGSALGKTKDAFSKTAEFFSKHAGKLNIKGKASFVADKAKSAMGKLVDVAKATGGKIKGALHWGASVSTKAFTKSVSALKKFGSTTHKAISKALKWTASVATKAYKVAMAGLVKTAKVTGNGIKLAFNFLKANPLILLVTAITAVVVALTTLYNHNKKFRNFVNGLVKSAQNFFKGLSKWFGKAYNKVMGFFKAVLKFVKKDWKELLLFIVNPFAGAFALVYKHNAKFRKAVNNLVKSVINFFKNMGKNVINTFKDMVNRVANFYKGLFKTLGNISNSISKAFVKSWNGIKNFFGDIWGGMKKIGHDAIWSIKNTLDDVLGKIGKGFSNTWDGVKTGFKSMWEGMKQLAGDGINAVIGIPNAGISGINSLIHDFGGPKSAIGKIPKVKFAEGTGALGNTRRAITKPTLAVLNDGNDSPSTGNREMLIHPNGQSELVEGRNTKRILAPGTEVLNATETAMMMGMIPTHFAGGTGFWSRLWGGVTNVAGNAWDGLKNGVKKFTSMLSFITNAVAHPVKTLEGKMGLKTDSLDAVYKDFGGSFFKKVKGQAKDWWKTLWNMASDSSEAGADGGMKGDDYRFKDRAPDSGNGDPWGYFFKECVSFVASRLANLGVPAGKFSHLGNGRDWVNAKVPHMSKPKVGSVAVYSNGSEFGNHVAMVTGVQGNKISGEEYNWNGNHAYHQYHGRNASGATTFLDFGLGGGDNTTEVKADSPLAKLIKKQTGGMMKWISKFIAPLNADSGEPGSGTQALPSGGHKNWLKQAGITGDFDKWNFIINHESGWNPKAQNPSSSAYGIGQALPPSKMASFGSDYMTNPITQLKWMKSYVNGRYGGINGAYKWWKSHNWYENGGIINQDSIIRVAEENKPEMVIPLASEKKSRANQLLTEANQRINGNGQPVAESADLTHLEQSVDNLVSIVSLLLGVNQEQLKALSQQKGGVGIDGLLNQMANRQSAHNYQAI